MIYFEDFCKGETRTSEAEYEVTKENIMEFAREWDPLPFHIDEEEAKASPVGRLFASGVQTVAIGIKLLRTMETDRIAYVAGLGWEKYELVAPVFPGYRLKLRTTVSDKRMSRSNGQRGIITTENEIINQNGEVMARYLLSFMVLSREAASQA